MIHKGYVWLAAYNRPLGLYNEIYSCLATCTRHVQACTILKVILASSSQFGQNPNNPSYMYPPCHIRSVAQDLVWALTPETNYAYNNVYLSI